MFNQAHVLVIGDVLLDRYLFGRTTQISAEAPVPICQVDRIDQRPGGAANVAMNIVALGGACSLIGVVGDDEEALCLHRRLTEAGVNCYLQNSSLCQTIVKVRVLSQHQQLVRLDYEQPYTAFSFEDLYQTYTELLSKVDIVILSDYGKGTLKHKQAFIQAAKQQSMTILAAPSQGNDDGYQGSSLMMVNEKEFAAANAKYVTETSCIDQAIAIIHRLDLQAMLVTKGSKGMHLVVRQGDGFESTHVPAIEKSIYDVTGVRDTVMAVIALARARDCDWLHAVRLANAAVSIVVTKLGTATITREELNQAIDSIDDPAEPSILSETELKMTVQLAQQSGETIVMTNGCFDLLHAGHVAFLQAAKQLGDRLIVAVNTDTSVQRHKGPHRPIVPLAERAALLARLQVVDWVIPFDDDTPERLLRSLKPCILAKGGDYSVNDVVGAEIVLAYGGKVDVIPHAYTDIHTTDLIRQLNIQIDM